jgi:hypothetical protein
MLQNKILSLREISVNIYLKKQTRKGNFETSNREFYVSTE